MLFRNFKDFDRLFKEFDELFFDKSTSNDKPNIVTGSDKNGEWEKRTYVSDNGLFSYSYFTRKPKNNIDEISKLKNELDLSVEKQDFERAVELRDKIKNLEINKEEISKLNSELNESIQKQDFENAIILRDKLKKLK